MPEIGTRWPVYFAGRDLIGPNLTIKKGQAYPPFLQDAQMLVSIAKSAGVADPTAMPFHELPHVKIVAARSLEEVQTLVTMTYADAQRLVATGRAA